MLSVKLPNEIMIQEPPCEHQYKFIDGFSTCILCGETETGNFEPIQQYGTLSEGPQKKGPQFHNEIMYGSTEVIPSSYKPSAISAVLKRYRRYKFYSPFEYKLNRTTRIDEIFSYDPLIITLKENYPDIYNITFPLIRTYLINCKHVPVGFEGLIKTYHTYVKFLGGDVSLDSMKKQRICGVKMTTLLKKLKKMIPYEIRRELVAKLDKRLIYRCCDAFNLFEYSSTLVKLNRNFISKIKYPPTRVAVVVYYFTKRHLQEKKITQKVIADLVNVSEYSIRLHHQRIVNLSRR